MTMTEKMYIALMLVVLLSVTEADITQDQCQLFCTAIGFPVCGSDGRTYGNPCELRAGNCLKSPYQQVTLVRNGTCDTSITYPQTVSYPTPPKCSLVCTADYTPVCGSDGKTYSNACQVRVRNCRGSPYDQITIVRNGTCKTTTTTTTTPTTTTTTKRTTTAEYVNPKDQCQLLCNKNSFPVCGSDGRTYFNPCELRTENCLRSPYQQVTLVRNGTCDTTTYPQSEPYPTPRKCSLVCTEDYTPVCGSDGKTYSNACQVRVRNCRGSPYDQITIVSNGTCKTTTTTAKTTTTTKGYQTTEPVNPYGTCRLGCTRQVIPVCGSDGITYNNPCELRVGNCFRSPYEQVVLVSKTRCYTTATTTTPNPYRQSEPYPTPRKCSLVCAEDYTPVCGSDGKTYSNACQLRVRNCQGLPIDQITIVYNGSCVATTTRKATTTTTTKTYRTVYR